MACKPLRESIAQYAMACYFYAALVKSVYTNVTKLAVPVGYNFNCTNIFLGISEPLALSHCFMGKISVLRKQWDTHFLHNTCQECNKTNI